MSNTTQEIHATVLKVDAQAVQVFLDHIAWGRQNEAEAMLKANKELALASGNVTDHAKRTFTNISGFQYALWALDYKMWIMIQQYLTLDATVEQAKGFTQGSWVKEHAEHANWKNLIHELEEFIDHFELRMGSWNWDTLGKHWVEKVGAAQFKLPMHVLQEYCNPNRPFDPCPDFSTQYQIQRTLPDWLKKGLENARFDFGILRCSFKDNAHGKRVMTVGTLFNEAFSNGRDWTAVLEVGRGGALSYKTALADQTAVIKLFDTRVKQRAELIAGLPSKLSTEAEAEQFRKMYLADTQLLRTFRDADNNTVFHLAAKEGYVGLIEVLKLHVAYDAQNKMGLTPLLLAAQHGKLEMVMALLSSAPKSAIAQKDLLSVLVGNEQFLIFNAILHQEKLYETLLINVGQFHLKNKDTQPDKKLMTKTAIGEMYKTALDIKSIPMLTFLIQIHPEGLNVLYNDQSPLHYAIKCKFAEAVHLLADKGSDLALPNKAGERALELAEKEALDLVSYLKNEECKLEQSNKDIAQKKLEVEENRLKFVEEFSEMFSKQTLPAQKNYLQNDKNLGRLKRLLTKAIKEANDNLFVSKEYHKLSVLMEVLNKMLLEKIQIKDEVTKSRTLGHDLFEKKKLSAALQAVINSSWQVRIEIKDVKKQEEVKAQRELSDNQASFCEHFEKQFDDAYSYFKALHSGEVKSNKDIEAEKNLNRLGAIAQGLPNISASTPMGTVSIPTASIVSGALTLVQYYRENCRRAEAERIVNLFSAVTPYERTHFVRFAAEQIADMYRDQIEHLKSTSEGVEIFAQCAAARVVEYIISDESHQKSYTPGIFLGFIHQIKSFVLNQEIPPALQKQKNLCDIFIDGILRVTSKFPKELIRLQTINSKTLNDNWRSKEIFENTGIMVLSGDRYQRYSQKDVDLDRYGYCYGTIQEAKRRGLSLGPSSDKLWGLGRQWERVKPTLALTALPANHAQPSNVLILSAAIPKAEVAVGSQQNTNSVKLGK